MPARSLVGALVAMAAIVAARVITPVPAGAGPPDGLISGRPHVVRFRPELGTLPREPRTITRREAATAAAVVASCDPARVAAARVPTTARADDAAAACVVLPVAGRAERAFLGPAVLTGDGIVGVEVRRRVKGDQILVRLTTEATNVLAPPKDESELPNTPITPPAWRVDVDGQVVGVVTAGRSAGFDQFLGARLVVTARAPHGDTVDAMADAIDEARGEQLIQLADQATMTDKARRLLAASSASIDEKTQFVIDCPTPETTGTLVLGCYRRLIFVLRVDRPDLAPVMTVTAAHEMLHAAYHGMSRAERRRVVNQLNAFMDATGDARIEALLAEYDRLQPGTRDNELHSLVGTQVHDLPPPLERYYRQFFADRSAVVDAFDAYQQVFDDLQARYDQLDAELRSQGAELHGLQAEATAAGQEADRLANEIDSLRSQGRVEESDQLVGPQNAAVNRANGLAGTFNARVDDYNAKVAELNALAITLEDTYNEISPIPVEG